MQRFFLKFQSRQKTLLRCPKLETGFSPASRFEAPRHRSSWRPPQPRLKAKALRPPRGRCAPHHGAACHLRWFPGPQQRRCQQPGTTKVVGMLSSTRSTDKGTMNVLDLKQNTFTNASNKFQGIFSTTLIRFPHIIGILYCDHRSRHFLVWKTHNFAKHFLKNA